MSDGTTPSARGVFGRADHLLGFLLAAGYLTLLVATAPQMSMGRDESFYVTAANDYGRWFTLLADDPSRAMTRQAIDAAWDYNSEHPPLVKSAFALSHLAQDRWEVFDEASTAYRLPGMVSAALLLWLIYLFGARVFGRGAGIFAALCFATMPRVFYHAHLACFDVPITLAITFTVYCYWRSLTRGWGWALMTGFAFGLALATKHNSWVLPGIFTIHFLWVVWNERHMRRAHPEVGKHISLAPRWLLGMAVVGPVVFVASWPWLWNDGLERFGAYASFHLRHDYYNMAYFGRNYFRPPFPVAFPFVMTAFTVSTTTLLLALGTLGERARTLLPRGLASRVLPRSQFRADRRATDVLLVGCLAAPLLMIALPSSPIFGGTKHWMTAFPFVCMYAGYGSRRLAIVASRFVYGEDRPSRPPAVLVVATAAVLLAPGVVESASSHPYGLSHYTWASGGVPGAADHGMNRQFWGYSTSGVAAFLTEQMPGGGSVYICDMTYGGWQMMQRDGAMPTNIRPSASLSRADFVLVHHEHHFAEVDFQAWVAFGDVSPAFVFTHDGVPLVSVYENPRRRR